MWNCQLYKFNFYVLQYIFFKLEKPAIILLQVDIVLGSFTADAK